MQVERTGDTRENNFNAIRLLGTVMVIFSHSYHLSEGAGVKDPLQQISTGDITIGLSAVMVLFFIAGYLCTGSVERRPRVTDFLKSRAERLLPELIVVTIAITFLVGPFLSTRSIGEYFKNIETYKYLLNAIMIPVHELPGVFDSNIYGPTVNGSLWTMPVEFLCFAMGYVVIQLGIRTKKRAVWLTTVFVLGSTSIWVLCNQQVRIRSAILPCIMFYEGILYSIYWKPASPSKTKKIACVVALSAVFILSGSFLPIALLLFLPPVILTMAFELKISTALNGIGRYAYGMYLWAFPIQQAIVKHAGGSMESLWNFILTLPLDFACGYVLYHLNNSLRAFLRANPKWQSAE